MWIATPTPSSAASARVWRPDHALILAIHGRYDSLAGGDSPHPRLSTGKWPLAPHRPIELAGQQSGAQGCLSRARDSGYRDALRPPGDPVISIEHCAIIRTSHRSRMWAPLHPLTRPIQWARLAIEDPP